VKGPEVKTHAVKEVKTAVYTQADADGKKRKKKGEIATTADERQAKRAARKAARAEADRKLRLQN